MRTTKNSCGSRRQINYKDHQDFPSTGPLAKRFDLSLHDLRQRLPSRGAKGWKYVATSVRNRDGMMCQKGCGPNIEGGHITLCTCIRQTRTYAYWQDWEGQWIACFTSLRHFPVNYLFYLMKVQWAFESHAELWFSTKVSDRTRIAKAAHNSPFGDVYKPRFAQKHVSIKRFDPSSYEKPCDGHDHKDPSDPSEWHKDINYKTSRTKRPSALLVGDSKFSFVWRTPRIVLPGKLSRAPKQFDKLQDLLSKLQGV